MRSKKIKIGLLIALLSATVGGASIPLGGRNAQAAMRRQSPRLPQLRRPQARMPAYPELPLAFTENRGQTDPRAAFLVQGRDTTVWFGAQGMTLALTRATGSKSATTRQRWNLKLDFVGANAAVPPIGQEPTHAQISYFTGAPAHWRTGIKSYAELVYPNLWPGIDLVYGGTDNRLKYEFVVKPGADPQQIRLAYRGTNAPLAVNGHGQLEVSTPFGVIHDDKPISVQGKHKEIKTEYVVYERAADGAQQYGFKLGKYDRRKTLIIDPAILIYSGFLGGGGDDEGHAIAVDAAGNAYVTGVTTSAQATFPEVAGPDLTYNGRSDAFVAKLAANGAGLVYAGYIGGDGDDAGHGIAVDGGGNAYVTGWTNSPQATFPVAGALDPTFNGAIDAFVAKLNPSGTALVYCGYLGGDDEDEGLGIAVNAAGNAFVTGLTASTEKTFPKLVGPGLLFKGAVDAFVARVKADGSGLDYAGYLGGSGDDQGRGIAVDAGGNAYVAGLTTSSEATFPMVGPLDPSFNGGTDAFVAKLNATGSAISYAGYIGGNGNDEAYGIAVDGAGNAYLTGRTTSTEATFPETGGPDLTFNGAIDAFVAKLNPAGATLSYAGYIGGSGEDEGFGIAVDNAGNALVTGRTTSSAATFPAANAFDATLNGTADGFIAKVNAAGGALAFAGYLGGNGLEEGFGAAVLGLRQVYAAGRSTSADNFPALIGPSLNFGGASDAFVLRLDDTAVNCAALTIGPATLPNAALGAAYSQSLTAAGGTAPYGFAVVNGALPPGLALALNGTISGTPTQTGAFNFTVSAADAVGCLGVQAVALTVTAACGTITVNPATLPNGFVGTNYNQTVSATGGAAPYNFTVGPGTLPPGLALNATSGALTGLPTTVGAFTFTLKATDKSGCMGTREYVVNIGGNGLQFYPLPRPLRLLDTRPDQSLCDNVGVPIAAMTAITTQARITCNNITIPASAQAIVGNVTVINQTASFGFLTLFPAGQTLPLAANIIYEPGQLLSNNFTVGLNANGEFSTFAERTLHTVIDVSGYFAPPGAGGLFYHALPRPLRLMDTRADQSLCDNVGLPITGMTALTTQARITCNGITIPTAAQAIVGNATVINQTASFGFMTLFPSGQTLPLAANMIYAPNQLLANAFTVGLSANGQFDTFAERTLHLVIDIAGYYSTEANDLNGPGLLFNPLPRPLRLLDTRADQSLCDNVGLPIAAMSAITTQARVTCNGITIPATAQAVNGNITVINQTASFGFLTLFPSGQTLPLAANMIYAPGQLLSNAFTVGLSAGGAFDTFGERTIHVVIDVSGYFAP